MTDLDELIALRPLVSELRHTVEALRRENAKLHEALSASDASNIALHRQIVAMRDSARNDRTPAMGNQPIGEDHG